MYEFIPLNPASFDTCKTFIPEKILESLYPKDPLFKVIAFCALYQNTPVGACFALLDINLHYLEILHLEVASEYRNQHIATTLIAKIHEEGIKNNAKIFSFIYTQNSLEAPIIEKILKNNRWQGSRPFLIRCTFNFLTFDTPWIHKKLSYPPNIKEFLWKDLHEKDRNELIQRQNQEAFPSFVSPFNDEEKIEKLNSLGIRYKNRIIGWMITHRIDQDTIRYSSLFIERPFYFQGLAMKLLANSLLLHMQARTKYACLEIPLLQVHPTWIRFIERRFVPYASSVIRLRQGWHTAF